MRTPPHSHRLSFCDIINPIMRPVFCVASRNNRLYALAALLLAIVGIGAAGCASRERSGPETVTQPPPPVSGPEIRILRTLGETRVRREGRWVSAVQGRDISTGDIVAVGRGELLLEWVDVCLVRLGETSMARILEPSIGDSASRSSAGIRLSWGHAMARCPGYHSSMRFEIRTSGGMAETLGGAMAVDVLDGETWRVFAVRDEVSIAVGNKELRLRPRTYLDIANITDASRPESMSREVRTRFREEEKRIRLLAERKIGVPTIDLDKAFRVWDDAGYGVPRRPRDEMDKRPRASHIRTAR